MNLDEFSERITKDAKAVARKFFVEGPPVVGFWFPRPLSGVARQVVETIAARAYVEGYKQALKDGA